jgi:hypothetical protein
MGWTPWIMAGCFAALCVALIAFGQRLRQQAVTLVGQAEQGGTALTGLRRELAEVRSQAEARAAQEQRRLLEAELAAARRFQELQRFTGSLTNQLVREAALLRQDLQATREESARLGREKQALEEALAGVERRDARRLAAARLAVLRPAGEAWPRALGTALWLGGDRRGLLLVEGAPAPHPSQDYQLWLTGPGGTGPVSGGVFRPDETGAARLEFTAAGLGAVERFAVTVEARGGAAQPGGKPVLAGP